MIIFVVASVGILNHDACVNNMERLTGGFFDMSSFSRFNDSSLAPCSRLRLVIFGVLGYNLLRQGVWGIGSGLSSLLYVRTIDLVFVFFFSPINTSPLLFLQEGYTIVEILL